MDFIAEWSQLAKILKSEFQNAMAATESSGLKALARRNIFNVATANGPQTFLQAMRF